MHMNNGETLVKRTPDPRVIRPILSHSLHSRGEIVEMAALAILRLLYGLDTQEGALDSACCPDANQQSPTIAYRLCSIN
jgi:hypothetical protein